MQTPVLQTPRLRLRGWREADVEALAAIYTDPEVVRYLRPMDLESTRRQVLGFELAWEERNFGQWAVEERETGRLLGRTGLWWHDDWTASAYDAEVGWTLERAAWGKGLATEGGAAVLRWAFEERGLERIISIAHRDNGASLRVMEKLGLTQHGATEWRSFPVVWFGIERPAWLAQQPPVPTRS